MKNYLPAIQTLTNWLKVLLLIFLVIKVLYLLLFSFGISLLNNLNGNAYKMDAFEEYSRFALYIGLLGALQFLLFLVISVLFLIWLVKMCNNLREHEYFSAKGPAIVIYWFVPIVNLFKPYQIIRELYRKMQAHLEKNNLFGDISLGALTGIWWFLWVLMILIMVSMPNISVTFKSVNFSSMIAMEIITNLMYLVVSFLFMRMIVRFKNMAEQFAEINWEGEDVDLSGHLVD